MKKALRRLGKNKKYILIADAVLLLAATAFVFALPKPGNAENLQISDSSYSTAEISWDKAAKAKGYCVYRSDDGVNYEYLDYTTDTNYTDKKLRTGKTYYYTVESRNGFKSGKPDITGAVDVVPSLDTPKLKVDPSDGEIQLSYSAVDGALGYEIIRDGEVIGESNETSFVDKEAEGDKKYKYEVKAYRYASDPVYSEVSNSVNAIMHAVQNFTVDTINDDLELTWDRSDHYSKFRLYNGSELLTETDSNSYLIENFEMSKIYDIKLVGYNDDETLQSPDTGRRFEVVEEPMTNEDAREAACEWAVKIADDNSFTYGTGRRSHNYGCYFCKTNVGPVKNKKGKSLVSGHSYAKTYCCNPFVTACYAHGAADPGALSACQRGTGYGFSAASFKKHGPWENIGKPSLSSLQKGDVLLWSSHVMIYIGDGRIAHAKTEGWGAGSIGTDKAASYYKRTKFVMRYTGSGSGTKNVIRDVDDDGNLLDEEGNIIQQENTEAEEDAGQEEPEA